MTKFVFPAVVCLLSAFSVLPLPAGESLSIQHNIAAIEKDKFHGWPANNGVWQWGDEILVGLTQGEFQIKPGHNIAGHQESFLARSTDGGETWKMFDPEGFLDDGNEKFLGKDKKALKDPMNFSQSGFAMRMFGEGYHGNEDPEGGFFFSYDRGQSWKGPYTLNGLTDHPEMKDKYFSPRTDYLIQDARSCFIFISARSPESSFKRMACIRTTDGGQNFEFVSWITPETNEYRSIMSQTIQLSDTEFLHSYRKITRKKGVPDSIETSISTDSCKTWKPLSTVKNMLVSSNPPALVRLIDGRICCVYGDRNVGEIRGRYSNDHGRTWGPEFIVRDDYFKMKEDYETDGPDIGYVRLVQRTDGKLVAIYYWANEENPQSHIAASIWKP